LGGRRTMRCAGRGGQLSFPASRCSARDASSARGGKLLAWSRRTSDARSCPGLSAAGHRAEPARPAAVDLHPARRSSRDGVLDLVLYQLADRDAQVLRESLDERAKRSIPISLGHDCCVCFAQEKWKLDPFYPVAGRSASEIVAAAFRQRPNRPLSCSQPPAWPCPPAAAPSVPALLLCCATCCACSSF